MSARDYLLANV